MRLRAILGALFKESKRLRGQRSRALRREVEARRHILRLYRGLRKELKAHLKEVERRLAGSPDGSEAVARTREQIRLIEAAIDRYAAEVAELTSKAGRAAILDGIETGAERLARVGIKFEGLPREALEELARQTLPDGPLRRLFDSFGPEASAQARKTIFAGLALGHGARKIGAKLAQDLEAPRTRALLIAADRVNACRRAGTLETYRRSRGTVVAWRWVASRSDRTCPMCLAMDGSVHPLDTPMATHPACRCSQAPVLREDPLGRGRESGKEWFERQPEETQRRILGPSKLELYKRGEITLDDLVAATRSEQWGPGRREATLKEVLSRKNLVLSTRRAGGGGGGGAPPVPPTKRTGGEGEKPKISAAIVLPKKGAMSSKAAEALAIIDSVHVDGVLPQISLRVLSRAKFEGRFVPRWEGGPRVHLLKAATEPMLTLVHEIGHVIDIEACGGGFVPASIGPEFADWREAAGQSDTIQALWFRFRQLRDIGVFQGGFTPAQAEAYRGFEYLLRPWEVWARAYSQYIAVESGDRRLLAELAQARSNVPLEQWGDAEFEPIRNEVGKILRLRGWK